MLNACLDGCLFLTLELTKHIMAQAAKVVISQTMGKRESLKLEKKTAKDLNKLITSVGKNCCSCWNVYHNIA